MLTILSKDLALQKVISLIYFTSCNLKYSVLQFWTNFCPFYRFDLYGEWPTKLHTHKFWISHKKILLEVEQHIPGCMRLTSCYSIFNILELPGFLPEMALTCIFIFLPHLCPMEEIAAGCYQCSPRSVTSKSSTRGRLCRDTQPCTRPVSRGIVLPTVPPGREWTQGSCPTSLTSRCWWESWEKTLCQKGFLTVPPLRDAPITFHSIQWKKEVEAKPPELSVFLGRKPPTCYKQLRIALPKKK